ncbi:Type IV fimbriae expression regulatory protein PilR [hydrothermal vent metagenome]|uniref:Type IV fimbriae expression regulatory protein PilR n=1 Tax=hydrothermal vent metagenome TaxID=652676 RepID=A0A3B1AFI9_9ZZZZ
MTPPSFALIVDDEPDIRELLELTLGRMNIETRSAADLAEARELLSQHRFDLCLTDMKLPDGNGIELVEHISAHHAKIPVAVITAHGNMEWAIRALKAGAFDFVSKPVDLHILRNLVNTALKVSESHPRLDRRSRNELLGDSKAMQRTRATIAKVARSQAPIYIGGESGTGKELVARLIHNKGPRANQPFVPVNCGAIPDELMESEFFGHKKGSFTGAGADKDGLFQAAEGGTLFLDEVADLPLQMQVKLLRAIQEKAVRPVGSATERPVDVRILSATHKNLATLVDEGRFRQDLYYRINVIELHVPPLRERREDIPQLTEHTLHKLARQTGLDTPHITPGALKNLNRYPFPGNVRELENILERAITLCEDNTIHEQDLQLPATTQASLPMPKPLDSGQIQLEEHLGEIEKKAIQQALEQTKYNKTAAAKLLGLSFRALRYRLKKLGLE